MTPRYRIVPMLCLTFKERVREGASFKRFRWIQTHTRQFTERRHNIHRLRDEIKALPGRYISTGNQEHLVINLWIRRPVSVNLVGRC